MQTQIAINYLFIRPGTGGNVIFPVPGRVQNPRGAIAFVFIISGNKQWPASITKGYYHRF
jgi:hypothetical protein